jgi:hypothetical protein
VSEEVALKIMKRFDTSGDGAIQLDEFKGKLYFIILETSSILVVLVHLLPQQYRSVMLPPHLPYYISLSAKYTHTAHTPLLPSQERSSIFFINTQHSHHTQRSFHPSIFNSTSYNTSTHTIPLLLSPLLLSPLLLSSHLDRH